MSAKGDYNENCFCCEKRKLIDSLLRNSALLSDKDLNVIIEMAERLAAKRGKP